MVGFCFKKYFKKITKNQHRFFRFFLTSFLILIIASSSFLSSFDIAHAATVPGAPTIGTATGGNAQATVTFSEPATASCIATGGTITTDGLVRLIVPTTRTSLCLTLGCTKQ